ncbi:hypothetical protein LRA02_23160 [Lentilactobacillus rapi]|uniref:Uncharacterized protein n=1 Tax=Lentilactobacillus rapi TaxID=481723 RepID=A0A512PQH3_9LACO|nr:hypothetical protein LRA02_23160 [Lentilactobacillus rapi]
MISKICRTFLVLVSKEPLDTSRFLVFCNVMRRLNFKIKLATKLNEMETSIASLGAIGEKT